jgi:hypothetical protein
MLTHLEKAEIKLSEQQRYSLDEVKKIVSPSAAGFYWIYTTLSIEDFKNSNAPNNPTHVNLSELAKIHTDLKHVIKQSEKDYWCIYNGKGKQLKKQDSC